MKSTKENNNSQNRKDTLKVEEVLRRKCREVCEKNTQNVSKMEDRGCKELPFSYFGSFAHGNPAGWVIIPA